MKLNEFHLKNLQVYLMNRLISIIPGLNFMYYGWFFSIVKSKNNIQAITKNYSNLIFEFKSCFLELFNIRKDPEIL